MSREPCTRGPTQPSRSNVDRRVAQKRYGKHVMDLAVRWVLDQPGITAALWGARHPAELEAVAGALDWNLDADTSAAIDQILRQTIANPIGPEFMAPPA